MIPSYGIEDPTNGLSFKSGKYGRGTSQLFNPSDSPTHYYSSSNSNSSSAISTNGSTATRGAPPPYSAMAKQGNTASSISGPPSPTHSFQGLSARSMHSVTEEEAHFQQQQQAQDMHHHRPTLQWLQQTCRPVFMKELTRFHNVPVPITAANAKHPSQIGGSQTVLVASWKQSQVQILPIDRWGSPEEVLREVQTLHKLRKCRQIIQLYGYLPNANLPSGQFPALLLQQPSYGSLRQFLDHHFSSFQWPERYKLALDMAQGLKYLSAQRVPCNMHSGNVLIDGEGVAVLTGFGTPAAMTATAPTHMTSQPSPSTLLVYMAPEKIVGSENYSPDWEIFSLGILLWELSSGRVPFDEIITRAESGPHLTKNMEQLSTAIVKGLREDCIPGTPEIYEQLFKMCWEGDGESRPPIEVVEETLQMLVVVEPMDMLMIPGEESSMPVSTVMSESLDGDSASRGSASVRSVSPGPGQIRPFTRPTTLHQAVSVSNADMTSWFILSGHDLNGYALVPSYSQECEITPIQTCLGHFLPSSVTILKELLELDVDITLLVKRSLHNCLHVLFDRFIPVRNENGSAHLMETVDILLASGKLDVNALDVQGYTPLHVLMRNPKISSDDVLEILKKMVAKGADTSIEAHRDGNVLALAAKYLHFEATRYILATDITASEPGSIDKAIEGCMTMTGRATDKFVNLRTKTRELLKLWTGKAATQRREKVCLKTLQEAGQVDSTGVRYKGKPSRVAPKAQMDCANTYYEAHVRKVRDTLFSAYIMTGAI